MKKLLTTLLAFAYLVSLNAQAIDEKVKNLMIADGTMGNIESLVEQTIDQQKQANIAISEGFWLSLNAELKKEAIPDFVELVSPIYIKSFSEGQINKLIEFYSSEAGKELVMKQPDLLADLNMPITQWLQNINAQIIDKVENRENSFSTATEIEKFEQRFKNEHGLTIVNLADLAVDKEHNPGTILLNFGETDGKQDITREVVVKNNTDSLLNFSLPLYLLDEVVTINREEGPLKPKEERAIKFTLNSKEAEGTSYTFTNIQINHKRGISLGVKYSAPARKLQYTISQDSLPFENFTSVFSKEYEFALTNDGGKRFRISEVKLDKAIAYVHFDQNMIEPGEKSTIKILFSQELIAGVQKVELNIKLELSKNEISETSLFPDKTVEIKIN